MYCPSLVHIGDKDTFYPFYPGTERKNKQPNKINLACCLQKHKENRCLLCSPCTSLSKSSEFQGNNKGGRELSDALPYNYTSRDSKSR